MAKSHEDNRRAGAVNPEHSGIPTGNPQLSDEPPKSGKIPPNAAGSEKGDRPGTGTTVKPRKPAHDRSQHS